MTTSTPIDRSSAADQVLVRLRQAIISGTIPPGEWLRQEVLAKRFHVSRMPVRDAINRLAAEGLVDLEPNRGARVVHLSAQDAADIFAVRETIEPMAAKLSAPLLTSGDCEEMAALLEALEDPALLDRYGWFNAEFHRVLCSRCPHARMVRLVAEHAEAAERYMRIGLSVLGHQTDSQSEHRSMLEAARRKDGEAISTLLAAHIRRGGRMILQFLKSRPSRSDSAEIQVPMPIQAVFKDEQAR